MIINQNEVGRRCRGVDMIGKDGRWRRFNEATGR